MNLTRYTDYSLRLLILLALKRDRLLSIQQVSTAYGISRNHLVKVATRLGRLGYVETVRGRNGGLRLARPATEIRVGAVVRDMEPSLDLLECFDAATDDCPITPACRLRGVLQNATAAFLSVLDDATIADLTRNAKALNGLLRVATRTD